VRAPACSSSRRYQRAVCAARPGSARVPHTTESVRVVAGPVFVRCVGGLLKRLFLHAASGGSATFPQAGDPTVSAQSLARGDPIAAGQHRYYTAYYRDPIVLGGCPAASGFNVADALDVVWAP